MTMRHNLFFLIALVFQSAICTAQNYYGKSDFERLEMPNDSSIDSNNIYNDTKNDSSTNCHEIDKWPYYVRYFLKDKKVYECLVYSNFDYDKRCYSIIDSVKMTPIKDCIKISKHHYLFPSVYKGDTLCSSLYFRHSRNNKWFKENNDKWFNADCLLIRNSLLSRNHIPYSKHKKYKRIIQKHYGITSCDSYVKTVTFKEEFGFKSSEERRYAIDSDIEIKRNIMLGAESIKIETHKVYVKRGRVFWQGKTTDTNGDELPYVFFYELDSTFNGNAPEPYRALYLGISDEHGNFKIKSRTSSCKGFFVDGPGYNGRIYHLND